MFPFLSPSKSGDTMSNEQLLKKLITLGLTSYEAKVYLAMMGRNSHTASEIAGFSGVPRQRVYDVLQSLHLKGLCVEVPGKVVRYHASKPRDALLGMLVEQNREFQQKLGKQRDTALNLADELAVLGELNGDSQASAGRVQILLHPNQMLRKYDELLLEAEEEILSTARLPYVQARAEETYEKVKNGVKVKFLIHDEVLEREPGMIEAIFRLYGNHEDHEIRFLSELPLKANIFDRKKVLFYLFSEDESGLMEIYIENPGLARSMAQFFELLWEQGTPSSRKVDEVARAIAEVRT